MFQWLNLRANCSAADACDRLRRGTVPRRMRVHGNLHLAGASWLTYLPNELEAQGVDVSGCLHLRGLPVQLKCEVLNLQRTNVECLQAGLQVSHRIDVTGCRKLQRVAAICVPELRLRDCAMLEALAEGLRARLLNLSGCVRLVELPASVAESVRELDLSGCVNVESLPNSFTRVETLSVRGCVKLKSLPRGIQIRSAIEVADSGLESLPTSLRSVRILWHGTRVPDRVAFDPESITVDEILGEQNVTWRRVLLERVGIERFMSQADARIADNDRDAGGERRLLRISFHNGEDVVCLVVHCPSTGHRYMLQVPPATRNCVEAAAWVAGYRNPNDYRPVMET